MTTTYSSEPCERPSMSFNWLKKATKPTLIKWFQTNKINIPNIPNIPNLSRQKESDLRIITKQWLINSATHNDIINLKETIHCIQKKEKTTNANKKHKEKLLDGAKKYLTPGSSVMVFDEVMCDRKSIYLPIKARVIEQENSGKMITVKFLETRPWHEAGDHLIYKGQEMRFKFDNYTTKWLREGLTPEVARTTDSRGHSQYFKLSYTRQYLVFP